MRLNIPWSAIATFLFTTVIAQPAAAQLNGNYTIGSAPSDYATIGAAVADLAAVGINGPVNFQIKSGTYDEQVTISYFDRFGADDDLVTFERVSGTVTWQFSTPTVSSNWIVMVDSASHVKFDDLDFEAVDITWGRLIQFQNFSSHITISNCRLTGIFGAITAASIIYGWGYNIIIEDNTFVWGKEAVETKVPLGLDIEKYTIRRNTFTGQTDYAIHLTYADSTVVNGNDVYSSAWSSSDFTGIRVSAPKYARISKNIVDVQIGETGIWLSGTSSGQGSRVGNNMVAIRDGGASSPTGIRIDSDEIDVYHNTVRTTQIDGEALYVSSTAASVSILNNILAADGGALALNVADEMSVDSSDYNILYSSGANLTEWEGNLNATIDDHRADSRHDFASYNAAVTFLNTAGTNDLHLAAPSDSDVRLIGPPRNQVTEDIDGDLRTNFTATRGADEGQPFTPLDNGDTGLGFYTVGGASPDFSGPANALRHLRLRGMKGPVTFSVRPGTYSVHRIVDPPRFLASAADTVLIRSSDPVNRPLFQTSSTGMHNNYALKIVDQTAIQIRNIDFEATGTPPYGRLIELDGDVDVFKLSKCSLSGFAGETSNFASLVYGNDYDQDEAQIANCVFEAGSYGVYLASSGAGERGADSSIKKSRFDDQAVAGIYSDHTSLLVEEDTITSSRINFIGIHIDGAISPDVISSHLHASGAGGIGLLLDGGNGSIGNLTPIQNNFLSGRHAGLKMENSARLYGVYNNTIRGREYGLYVDANAGATDPTLTFLNNMFVNTTSDPALFAGEPADVDSSDFNNITNDGGGTLVQWGAFSFGNVAAYKSFSIHDDSSVSQAVTFVDPATGDLHLSGSSIGEVALSGTPIPSVAYDIDGDARSPVAPYMGADEASVPLALRLTLDLDVLLEGPYVGGTMSTTLNDNGHLDGSVSSHPFSASPWNYNGSESVAAGFFAANPTVVDWVLCVLYSGTLPSITPEDTVAALVLSDGSVVSHVDGTSDPTFDAASGLYYVAVFHRNHLGIISSSKIDFGAASPAYNFTDAMPKAYGPNPMKDLGVGDFGLFAADDNADGQVTATDFNAWLTGTKAAATGYLSSDFNMDGQVTASDFNSWLTNTKVAAASQIP